MKNLAFAALVGAFCSLSCYSPDDYGPPPGRRGPRSFCEQFTTCGACTPMLGCGWCQAGDKGLCAADPNVCSGATSFSWTWDSNGCPGATDGAATSRADAGPAEHPRDGATDALVEHAAAE